MVRDSLGQGRRAIAVGAEQPLSTGAAASPSPAIEPWGIDQKPWYQGDGTALIGSWPGGPVWDYATLRDLGRQWAGRLWAQGLASGQLVAVPERPAGQVVLLQHAVPLCGAALFPIRDDSGFGRRQQLLAATGAEWVWRPDGSEGGRLEATGWLPSDRSLGGAWPAPLALVVETSGSSGVPRAVMLTAANLRASAERVNRQLGLQAGDVWLSCLPLRHIGGLSITYRCALAGAAMLLHEGFRPDRVMEDLKHYRVTHVSLVPPMLARLLDLGRPPPPSLRVVLVGGQPLDCGLAQRALERGWPLHLTYGMTETASQVACSERLSGPPAAGAVGLPLPDVEIDCLRCPGPPEVLRIRGPMVMAGYANPDRVPGDGLEDGWLRTSDLACRDGEGTLHVLGRADEVLVTAGVKVHPSSLEAVLTSAPGAGQVAVVGVPDAVWGQRVVALYTGGAAPGDLDAWCRERILGPERPRTFIRLPGLPTLGSGKRDRLRLRELVLALGEEMIGPRMNANERE